MWSTSDVLALAPDDGVAHAARGLAVPASWIDLGSDDVGVWGLYRGTSAEPYDVAVDRSGPAWRCSCPSRKLPCKHALGLLLLWAEGSCRPPSRPSAVSSWLAARAAAARRRRLLRPRSDAQSPGLVAPGRPSAPGSGRPAPRPTVARQRRADERAARVRAGLEELDRWLADQVRRGLGRPGGHGPRRLGGRGAPAWWTPRPARWPTGSAARRTSSTPGRAATARSWPRSPPCTR